MKTYYVPFVLLFLIFNSSALYSQIPGDWYGAITDANISIRVNLHIEQNGNILTGTLDSPDQGAFGLPIDKITFENNLLNFQMADLNLSYRGIVDMDFTRIEGTLEQSGQSLALNFSRTVITPPKSSPEYFRQYYDKEEVYIPMRDGVSLFTSIYSPKDKSQSYPILMMRTPYNSEPGGQENYNFFLSFLSEYLEEGYIMVFQDVRGTYMSEGEFMDVRPFNPDKKTNKDIDENSDTWDAIQWLVHNVPNNNGRVGIHGISYPGFYATMSLMDAHPALKAVSPQAPVTDWFIGDDDHHNGAFFMMDVFNFLYSFGQPRPEPTRNGKPGFDYPGRDNYRFFMDIGTVKNITEKYFGDSILYWHELINHPNYDDFWKARTPIPHLKNIKPAVLTVGGWFDAEDLYGTLNTYKAIETQSPQSTSNRIMMGPWFHGQWTFSSGDKLGNVYWGTNTSDYGTEQIVKFFNYYLKDEGTIDLPEAIIYITGANQWTEFEKWPPENISETHLYFQKNGDLSFDIPGYNNSYDEYVSDPMNPVPYTEDVHLYRTTSYMTDDQRFAATRPDVMVYETNELQENFTFAGPVTADLYVTTTGTDADYVVKLIDVFPDTLSNYPENDKNVPMQGYQMLVRGDVMRGRFRNSYENPEPFTPGKITRVKFVIPDIAHTFKKGHRIMIQVQNSWFPLVDRNPQKFVDIYHCSEEDFQKATHRIYHDQKNPSHVTLWKLEKP
jgi:hypothetical protein